MLKRVLILSESVVSSLSSIDKPFVNKIIKSQRIGGFVIGWPLNMDGSEGPRCDSTRDFCYAFLRKFDIPICLHDERLSSIAVEKIMIEANLTRKKRFIRQDSLAASWILQSILDKYNNNKLD